MRPHKGLIRIVRCQNDKTEDTDKDLNDSASIIESMMEEMFQKLFVSTAANYVTGTNREKENKGIGFFTRGIRAGSPSIDELAMLMLSP